MDKLTQITIVEKAVHKLLPGEATLDKRSQTWFVGCPDEYENGGIANLAGHDVTYNQSTRVLTVSPSILCSCGAHYFIEHNHIRWV